MTTKLTGMSTKAEEIAAIRRLAWRCTSNTYLASLFTPDMMAWVEHQIEMDLPPDLFATLVHQEQSFREMRQDRDNAAKELEASKLLVTLLRTDYSKLVSAVYHAQEALAHVQFSNLA